MYEFPNHYFLRFIEPPIPHMANLNTCTWMLWRKILFLTIYWKAYWFVNGHICSLLVWCLGKIYYRIFRGIPTQLVLRNFRRFSSILELNLSELKKRQQLSAFWLLFGISTGFFGRFMGADPRSFQQRVETW